MIIGGAFQGKLAYGKRLYPDVLWVDGSQCPVAAIESCGGIYQFQEYIRRLLTAGEEERLAAVVKRLVQVNPEVVIISDEVGCGLVPADAFERKYREQVGRICTELAACSERVDRVVCGVGVVIKGKKRDGVGIEADTAGGD